MPRPELKSIGDVALCPDQRFARNPDDPLIGAAPGVCGQLPDGFPGDVPANNGKVTSIGLKQVRTSVQTGRSFVVGVWRRAKSSFNHSPGMLCYSTVTSKSIFCDSVIVPKAEHYQTLCAEVVRLLREERERRELSNYAVSKRCGVSQTMLGQVERGLRNPSLETILRMADGIGADLPQIIRKVQANAPKGK